MINNGEQFAKKKKERRKINYKKSNKSWIVSMKFSNYFNYI